VEWNVKLGVFAAVFGGLSLPAMLDAVRALRYVTAVEIGTGCWPGAPHLDLDRLLACPEDAKTYRQRVADAGLTISALSCHGNPLHPDRARAGADDETFRKTVSLASQLDVPVVVTFSGCPGDSADARHANWVTTTWPPEYSEILEWQWNERAVPYWRDAGAFARDHGVKVAIEPHPGFLVYNVETALRLRAAGGPNVGVNFDPSHFFWQGMDPVVTIGALGDAIFHVHAKDVALNRARIALNGVLDTKSYRQVAERSWTFRTVGWGHDELIWKQIVSALRIAGYDYVMSIEHEDPLASIDEGLRSAVDTLRRVLLTEPPVDPWWT
jgi:sugar phosphate isomerase/epimerase